MQKKEAENPRENIIINFIKAKINISKRKNVFWHLSRALGSNQTASLDPKTILT